MRGLRRHQLLRLAVRYPGRTNRLIRDGSIDLARRSTPEQLTEQVRGLVGHHSPFPGLTCQEVLVDAIGHSFDVAVPLARELTIPAVEIARAADRVLGYQGRGKAKVFRRLPLDGIRLVASDHVWSVGEGPEVRGVMADLFLLLTGRTARLGALDGPGATDLRARLGHTTTSPEPRRPTIA